MSRSTLVLNPNDSMSFSDGSKQTYENLFNDLRTRLSLATKKYHTTVKDYDTLLNVLRSAFQGASIDLANNKVNTKNEGYKTIQAFSAWARDLHTQELRGQPSIIRVIMNHLRSVNNPSPEESLLALILEGVNGFKMFGKKAPHTDYLATALLVDAVNALRKLGREPGKEIKFPTEKEFKALTPYVIPQRKLESEITKMAWTTKVGNEHEGYTEVANCPVYRFLAKDINALDFTREKNSNFLANHYRIDLATQHCIDALKKRPEKFTQEQLKEATSSLQDIALVTAKEIEKADGDNKLTMNPKSANIASNIARWDASEWLARIETVLSAISSPEISGHLESSDLSKAADIFRNNPVLKDISISCRNGSFLGAKQRAAMMNAQMGIVGMYTQQTFLKPEDVGLTVDGKKYAPLQDTTKLPRNTTSYVLGDRPKEFAEALNQARQARAAKGLLI